MKKVRRILALAVLTVCMVCTAALQSYAIYDTMGNEWVIAKKTPTGKVGRTMTISFTLRNAGSEKISNIGIGLSPDVDLSLESNTEGERVDSSYIFPFEVYASTFNIKRCGSLAAGADKSVSLQVKVRRDITEGYYYVPIKIYDNQNNEIADEYINIWIQTATDTDDDEKDEADYYEFVLGEGNPTPHGAYPNVMNFAINMRNNSHANVYDVTAEMVLDSDDTKFPFEINDGNYDRNFERIMVDETVPLAYSMAIRKDVYTGYYPITLKIRYSDSSAGGARSEVEETFFVYVRNKDKEDDYREFNEHDRTRARIVIDGYSTVPEKIIAGMDFELTLKIKNASQSVGATNLLFSVESEKVSDSAVFSTESGSSSIAVNNLAPGQTTEIKLHMLSKAGVDQRSYALTVKAKYDSPEFKNAEESLLVDIPIYQIARLNTGTFEVMPDAISVGDETNVMFGINNTGKIILYNVMAIFEADSISPMESYVGNIKPGETGNVDCMLTAIAPTMDDGNVKVIISYEDENGVVSTEEKTMKLYVSEAIEENWEDMETFEDMNVKAAGPWEQYKTIIIAAAVAAVTLLAAIIMTVRRKRRKKAEAEEDMEDEIS